MQTEFITNVLDKHCILQNYFVTLLCFVIWQVILLIDIVYEFLDCTHENFYRA